MATQFFKEPDDFSRDGYLLPPVTLELTALLHGGIWCTHGDFTKLEALNEAKVFQLTLIAYIVPKCTWLGRCYAYLIFLKTTFQIKIWPERGLPHLLVF